MKNNRKLGFVSWGVGLALSNLLLFCLCSDFSASFWCTFIFVWIAAITSLIFQIKSWEPRNKPKESVLHISALTIAIGYMVVQIPISIIMALGAATISWKMSLLINGIICVLAWLLEIGSLAGNDHIDKVNQRQYTNDK